MIISIDPGKFKVAYAIWDPQSYTLVSAGLVIVSAGHDLSRVAAWAVVAYWVDVELGISSGKPVDMIVEIPEIYRDAKKTDPNDLIDLAGVVGAIASKICVGSVVWSPLPKEWKGQLPKHVTQSRVDAKLSDLEKSKIKWPAKHLKHNTYDAIHLGLTYLAKKGLRI